MIIKVFTMVPSSISILLGTVAIYCFLAIDYKKRLQTLHIILVISLGLLKAIFLLPSRAVSSLILQRLVMYNFGRWQDSLFPLQSKVKCSFLNLIINLSEVLFMREVYSDINSCALILGSLAFILSKGYVPLTNNCYLSLI